VRLEFKVEGLGLEVQELRLRN